MTVDPEWVPFAEQYGHLWADAEEDPWMPGTAYGFWPEARLVLNPAGVRHIMFDRGRWYRVLRDRYEPVTAVDAVRLRPADVRIIMTATHLWMLKNASSLSASSSPTSSEKACEMWSLRSPMLQGRARQHCRGTKKPPREVQGGF